MISHISRDRHFFSEGLCVYFNGLTPEIHDSLDVKTSKLAFRAESEGESRRRSTEVFPVVGECRKCVQTEMEKRRVLKGF